MLWAFELGLCVEEAALKFKWEAAALKGLKFGPKKTRRDALHKLIEEIVGKSGVDISATNLLADLRETISPGSIIEEIEEDGKIWWGKMRSTSFHRLEGRLGEIKKRLRLTQS